MSGGRGRSGRRRDRGALSAAELDGPAAPETAKEDVGQRLATMQRLLGLMGVVGDAMQALEDD